MEKEYKLIVALLILSVTLKVIWLILNILTLKN